MACLRGRSSLHQASDKGLPLNLPILVKVPQAEGRLHLSVINIPGQAVRRPPQCHLAPSVWRDPACAAHRSEIIQPSLWKQDGGVQRMCSLCRWLRHMHNTPAGTMQRKRLASHLLAADDIRHRPVESRLQVPGHLVQRLHVHQRPALQEAPEVVLVQASAVAGCASLQHFAQNHCNILRS